MMQPDSKQRGSCVWAVLLVLGLPIAGAEVIREVDSQGRVTYTNSPDPNPVATPVPVSIPSSHRPPSPRRGSASRGPSHRFDRAEKRQLEVERMLLRNIHQEWLRFKPFLDAEANPDGMAAKGGYDRGRYRSDRSLLESRTQMVTSRIAQTRGSKVRNEVSFYLPAVVPTLLREPLIVDEQGKWELEWRLEAARMNASRAWLNQLRSSLDSIGDWSDWRRIDQRKWDGPGSRDKVVSQVGDRLEATKALYRLIQQVDFALEDIEYQQQDLIEAARRQGAEPGWVR